MDGTPGPKAGPWDDWAKANWVQYGGRELTWLEPPGPWDDWAEAN